MGEISHQTDDQLELYALNRLPESLAAEVEEHLLVCVVCRERLDEVEKFALAMREATASSPEFATPWLARFWPGNQILIRVAGFAAVILALVLWLHPGRNLAPVAALQLTAVRGDMQSTEPARETDITLTDVKPDGTQRVEIVDAAGRMVWSGLFESDIPEVKVRRHLAPDSYFVRLYDGAGQLMHEYGFRVRKP